MKLLTVFLLAICATSTAQTIKTLGYNTTNGQVSYTGNNPLTFTNALSFGTNAAATRNNLGLGTTNSVFFRALDLADGLTIGDNTNSAIYFEGNSAAITRTNLGLGLPALTNTSNVTMLRALSGSTNTNHPFSGTVSVTGTNNTNTLTFSNGILQSVQ